jgi:uncharacterized membrane protein (DUF373 family)
MSLIIKIAHLTQDQSYSAFPRRHRRAKYRRLYVVPDPVPDLSAASTAIGAGEAADGDVVSDGQTTDTTGSGSRRHPGLIGYTEDLVHYVVTTILMGIAIFTLGDTLLKLAYALAGPVALFPRAAITAISGALLAVIVVEIARTVLAHFDNRGLQLQPFLIIGIISAVREVLMAGAYVSLDKAEHTSASIIHAALSEIGVNAVVVVCLAGSLVLIRRLGGIRP